MKYILVGLLALLFSSCSGSKFLETEDVLKKSI